MTCRYTTQDGKIRHVVTTDEGVTVLEAYRKHAEERAAEGVPAKPLNADQTAALASY